MGHAIVGCVQMMRGEEEQGREMGKEERSRGGSQSPGEPGQALIFSL